MVSCKKSSKILEGNSRHISYVLGILSRFMHKPCEGHWSAAKRVLIYLKGTQDVGLKYSKVDDYKLIGYSDSDFDGDKETGVSTSVSLSPSKSESEYPISLKSSTLEYLIPTS